jgi:hypothetical protein
MSMVGFVTMNFIVWCLNNNLGASVSNQNLYSSIIKFIFACIRLKLCWWSFKALSHVFKNILDTWLWRLNLFINFEMHKQIEPMTALYRTLLIIILYDRLIFSQKKKIFFV